MLLQPYLNGAPAADPKQGWTGPFMVLTDGLAFNGSAWTPELAACAPGGCLGDAPALGLDQHGLWRAARPRAGGVGSGLRPPVRRS